MRGKDGSDCYELTWCRITPAYAGKSYLRPDSHAHDKDHPCVCGEKVQLCTVKDQQLGSPLRMRGKVSCLAFIILTYRITPAYAGKSNAGTAYQSSRQDHPCICGEKYGDHNGGRDIMGSPLHMRGKVFISKLNSNINRITPAYAGKRLRDKDGKIYLEDHPCICGEKISGLSLAEMERGSPLHMRGKGYP